MHVDIVQQYLSSCFLNRKFTIRKMCKKYIFKIMFVYLLYICFYKEVTFLSSIYFFLNSVKSKEKAIKSYFISMKLQHTLESFTPNKHNYVEEFLSILAKMQNISHVEYFL